MPTASCAHGLSEEQIEFFVANNYVKVNGVIPRELCNRWVAAGCANHGIDLGDSTTWGERNVRASLSTSMHEVAPRLHAAICQLCGGADRVSHAADLTIDAGFVVNYDQGAGQPVSCHWIVMPCLREARGVGPHPTPTGLERKLQLTWMTSMQWQEPLGAHGGWHVDGDFNHFLDAPEAGLFFIIL